VNQAPLISSALTRLPNGTALNPGVYIVRIILMDLNVMVPQYIERFLIVSFNSPPPKPPGISGGTTLSLDLDGITSALSDSDLQGFQTAVAASLKVSSAVAAVTDYPAKASMSLSALPTAAQLLALATAYTTELLSRPSVIAALGPLGISAASPGKFKVVFTSTASSGRRSLLQNAVNYAATGLSAASNGYTAAAGLSNAFAGSSTSVGTAVPGATGTSAAGKVSTSLQVTVPGNGDFATLLAQTSLASMACCKNAQISNIAVVSGGVVPPPPPSSSSSSSNALPIGLGVGLGVGIPVVALLCFCAFRATKKGGAGVTPAAPS
jgi:hypothetical protein